MLTIDSDGKTAIIGWFGGAAGRVRSLVEAEGVKATCFVNDQPEPPQIINPPKRPAAFSCQTKNSFKWLHLLTNVDWTCEPRLSMEEQFDNCRIECRLSNTNQFLFNLLEAPPRVNFI